MIADTGLIFSKPYVCFLPRVHSIEVVVSGFLFPFYRIWVR